MAFHSGRVTFCRFRVEGDAPVTVDTTTLASLAEHSFQEQDVGAPEAVQAGWITGEHLFDTQFSFEKNGYGTAGQWLLFAMRLDTHAAPAEIKHAYQRINETALAAENPSGFASKGQKRDAAETAQRQVQEDLAAGKYRKSKIVPVMWDLPGHTLYCGALSNTVAEQLAKLMRLTFNLELTAISAGTLAGDILSQAGRGRDYEDLRPSPFTPAPVAVGGMKQEEPDSRAGESGPVVPWVGSSADRKDFLGNEFLIWLWYCLETMEGLFEVPADGQGGTASIAAAVDKALDMDCAWGLLGKQTLRGDAPTKFREAGEALRSGKWPRKAGLILSDGEHQWELSLQADRWIVSAAAMPEIPQANSMRELTQSRLELCLRLAWTLDGLLRLFLSQRASSQWPAQRQSIRRWIAARDARA